MVIAPSAVAPVPYSSSVYLATEAILAAGSEAQKEKWLPRLATGDAIGCFASSLTSIDQVDLLNNVSTGRATFDGEALGPVD